MNSSQDTPGSFEYAAKAAAIQVHTLWSSRTTVEGIYETIFANMRPGHDALAERLRRAEEVAKAAEMFTAYQGTRYADAWLEVLNDALAKWGVKNTPAPLPGERGGEEVR